MSRKEGRTPPLPSLLVSAEELAGMEDKDINTLVRKSMRPPYVREALSGTPSVVTDIVREIRAKAARIAQYNPQSQVSITNQIRDILARIENVSTLEAAYAYHKKTMKADGQAPIPMEEFTRQRIGDITNTKSPCESWRVLHRQGIRVGSKVRSIRGVNPPIEIVRRITPNGTLLFFSTFGRTRGHAPGEFVKIK